MRQIRRLQVLSRTWCHVTRWTRRSHPESPLLARTGGRRSGRACLLRPGISDVNLLRYCQGVIYFDAQISDGAFDLRVPEQKLDRPEISSAPIDEGSFSASQRMRSILPRIQPDTTDPIRYQARILACGDTCFGTAASCEQELAGPFVGGLHIIIDRLASLFAQFKSDRSAGLLLAYSCAIRSGRGELAAGRGRGWPVTDQRPLRADRVVLRADDRF